MSAPTITDCNQDAARAHGSYLQRVVSWHRYDGGFWLRIRGRGISVVNKQKHPPLFSERNGYRRVVRIGKLGVEWLPANH